MHLVDASRYVGFSRFLLLSYPSFFPRLIQSLRSEALKSEDMFMHLQEIQESIRLAFLNCFLHFSGIMSLNQLYVWLINKNISCYSELCCYSLCTNKVIWRILGVSLLKPDQTKKICCRMGILMNQQRKHLSFFQEVLLIHINSY